MDKKKKPAVTPQEMFEELDDDELSQVSGGTNGIPLGISAVPWSNNGETGCAQFSLLEVTPVIPLKNTITIENGKATGKVTNVLEIDNVVKFTLSDHDLS